jgi:PAS domain S-box-containing protein
MKKKTDTKKPLPPRRTGKQGAPSGELPRKTKKTTAIPAPLPIYGQTAPSGYRTVLEGAEAALRESERFLQTIIETEPECVKTLSAAGALLMMNRAGLAMIEAESFDQVRGQNIYSLIAPEHREAFQRLTEDVFRGNSGTLEFEMIGLHGRRLWLETHAVPLRNGWNEIIAHLGITRDITERKKAEMFVSNILETVDEGFIIIDRDYRIISVNKAYTVLAGRPAEEIIGQKCHEISHGVSQPCFEQGEECAVRRTFEDGGPHTVVHTHYDKKKDPIYVETKAFPMKDGLGRVTAAIEIVNNITEKKKLEDQLRHAQKMEAVGLLAGGIAHDFNNILTAIIGYGNLLEMKLPQDESLRAYVDQILAASARAANLTQSLLAFSRKQIINPRPVDVNDVITRVEKLLHRVIGEDVELRTVPASNAMTILADASQLEQVLMNLATNARDAMPEGGVLTIKQGAAVIDEAFRKVHGFGKDGAYACVTVSDSGVGMDERTRERIFEPFFTTKEMGRGTGLGLAIVYGIMKQNNGYVTVTSEPGKGSAFSLYFPIIEAAVDVVSPAKSIRNVVRGSGTILLAEDDPALRALLRTILREFGYTVIEAFDGEDAVEKFREYSDRVQLLILDVIMPKKNGREAFIAMRKIRPDVKTLFISGYHDDIVNRKVLIDDGCHFIAKPVSSLDLLDKVQQILAP